MLRSNGATSGEAYINVKQESVFCVRNSEAQAGSRRYRWYGCGNIWQVYCRDSRLRLVRNFGAGGSEWWIAYIFDTRKLFEKKLYNKQP